VSNRKDSSDPPSFCSFPFLPGIHDKLLFEVTRSQKVSGVKLADDIPASGQSAASDEPSLSITERLAKESGIPAENIVLAVRLCYFMFKKYKLRMWAEFR